MSEEFWLAGVSVAGTSHVSEGRPCEDAFYIGRNDEGFALIVNDGASSSMCGGEGARALASGMGRFIISNAPDVMSRKIRPDVVLDVALSLLGDLAAKNGGVRDDYATTLVALLVQGKEAMTCHIGDGAIFCLEGEFPRCISPPERAPGGGPYTTFVTSVGARPRMWHYEVPDYWTGFLCTTDGAEPALYNSVRNACNPLVTTIITEFDLEPSRAKREHALERACREQLQLQSEDDITLVAARRVDAGGAWGCPRCHRPLSKVHLTGKPLVLHGWCRPCFHSVFRRPVPASVVDEGRRVR